MSSAPVLLVGDAVLYYPGPPSSVQPVEAKVTRNVGGPWVALQLADGSFVEMALSVRDYRQSPFGGCCVRKATP